MSNDNKPCIICKCPFCEIIPRPEIDSLEIKCARCGNLIIESSFVQTLKNDSIFSKDNRLNISSWICENKPERINSEDKDNLVKIKTPLLAEKAWRIFTALCKDYPKPAQTLELKDFLKVQTDDPNYNKDKEDILRKKYRYVSIGYISDDMEFEYLINKYLTETKQFIYYDVRYGEYFITPQGWEEISRNPFPTSNTAFVAMNFDPMYDSLYDDVISFAVRYAGYEPYRVDRKPHDNYITNEIIAGIQRAKFVIADFTGNKAGVYFEAGLARGYGLKVIHMVNTRHMSKETRVEEKLHFDTTQIYHIVWQDNDYKKAIKDIFESILTIVKKGEKFDEDKLPEYLKLVS